VGRWVVAGLIALFVVPLGLAQAKPKTDGSIPAPSRIVRLITHVPRSTLNEVGAGKLSGPQEFNIWKLGSQLKSEGKPKLLTMNFAWCPHCAANSWALTIALSRFGKLSHLRVIDTGLHYCRVSHNSCNLKPFACFPHTHGLSFLDATFKSSVLSFGAIVLQDVHGHNLERPTRSENRAFKPFDAFGGAPAVDVGGAYGFLNSGYGPGALAHKTWSQIAGSLANPHNRIARHIDGLANLFTAAICAATSGRPASVCTQPGVQAALIARLEHAPPPPPPGHPGGPP
jgi:hypothetical protein